MPASEELIVQGSDPSEFYVCSEYGHYKCPTPTPKTPVNQHATTVSQATIKALSERITSAINDKLSAVKQVLNKATSSLSVNDSHKSVRQSQVTESNAADKIVGMSNIPHPLRQEQPLVIPHPHRQEQPVVAHVHSDERFGKTVPVYETVKYANSDSGLHAKRKTETPKHDKDSVAYLDPVYFPFNSVIVTHHEGNKLRSKLNILSEAERIWIIGYTDSVGNKQYNNLLARKRANAVKNYLVDLGVKQNTIVIDGYGKCCYQRSNSSIRNRAKNRRVEVLLKEDKMKVHENQGQST